MSPNIGVIRFIAIGITRFIAIEFTCDLLLLLSIYSIRSESNFPPAVICPLISNSVQSVGLSSYKVLKRDTEIIIYLFFLTYMPWTQRNYQRLQIVVNLHFLKVSTIKSLKSSQYCSYSLLSLNLYFLYSKSLDSMNLLILSSSLSSLDYVLTVLDLLLCSLQAYSSVVSMIAQYLLEQRLNCIEVKVIENA